MSGGKQHLARKALEWGGGVVPLLWCEETTDLVVLGQS